MSEAWTPEKFGQTLTSIFRQAAKDRSFRQRCLENPDGVIESTAGLPIPPAQRGKVQFSENRDSPGILLPPLGGDRVASKELSDQELESVAGGGSPYCMFTDGCYCLCTGKFTENWG
ncbi:MAG TPA: hypothetical protein VHH73_19760 [Verrucomicrobiae bacterium]|nr:hypothetical protein [Verrucomicrobiae bacterium]